MIRFTLLITFLAISFFGFSQELKDISLPAPIMTGGKPLMDALKDRQTNRDFVVRDFSEQQISNLLWAAFGINRPDNGKRTAPSAMDDQEIDIYVCLKSGIYH